MSNEEQERCETAAAADLLFLYMYDFLIPTMTYTYLAQCSKYIFFCKKKANKRIRADFLLLLKVFENFKGTHEICIHSDQ